MLKTLLRPFAAVVFVCTLLSLSEGTEGQRVSVPSTSLTATELLVGTDSRLQADQWARITDGETWRSVWRAHTGQIVPAWRESFESVDFSRSMIIAIVDKPDRKTTGIRVDNISIDDEIIFLDYRWIEGTKDNLKRRHENVFGFFVIPQSERQIVLRRWGKGQAIEAGYKVVASLAATTAKNSASEQPSQQSPAHRAPPRSLNITFAADPGNGQHDGVWGQPGDAWNLVSMGTTEKGTLRYADMAVSPVRMEITNHDGAWGIQGHSGVFHSYIYHNCQCVDLEATLLGMPAGRYRALVYAHGDAPNQNARIELVVGDRSFGKKATENDGSWGFRDRRFKEGVHYVQFTFEVNADDVVRFISRRDGSDYSMFNAIQIEPE